MKIIHSIIIIYYLFIYAFNRKFLYLPSRTYRKISDLLIMQLYILIFNYNRKQTLSSNYIPFLSSNFKEN